MTLNVILLPKWSRYFRSKIFNKMIIEKLERVEVDAKQHIEKESDRLKAIKSVRGFLSQIDYTAEVVPMEDADRLARLLVSLKGKPLAENEIDLINEIVKN